MTPNKHKRRRRKNVRCFPSVVNVGFLNFDSLQSSFSALVSFCPFVCLLLCLNCHLLFYAFQFSHYFSQPYVVYVTLHWISITNMRPVSIWVNVLATFLLVALPELPVGVMKFPTNFCPKGSKLALAQILEPRLVKIWSNGTQKNIFNQISGKKLRFRRSSFCGNHFGWSHGTTSKSRAKFGLHTKSLL